MNTNGPIDCNIASDLNKHHIKICESRPQVIRTVGLGIHFAINECQRQFKRERWNCPTDDDGVSKSVFGQVLDLGKFLLNLNLGLYAIQSFL